MCHQCDLRSMWWPTDVSLFVSPSSQTATQPSATIGTHDLACCWVSNGQKLYFSIFLVAKVVANDHLLVHCSTSYTHWLRVGPWVANWTPTSPTMGIRLVTQCHPPIHSVATSAAWPGRTHATLGPRVLAP